MQSHAGMGPACAIADVNGDRCTVWTGSQKPHYVRAGVAKLLGVAPDNVRAIWVTGPGSYGRNDAGDAALDAAYLSRATGKPVRVQGMRMDGTAWDPKGPACVHRARAALDAAGNVVAYEFIAKGLSRQHIATNESDPADSLVGQSIGIAPKGTQIFGVPAESYGFDNKLLAWETIPQFVDACSPLRTAHLRDPVGPEIHFGSEQFIDELARAAGEDPVAFPLRRSALRPRLGHQRRLGELPDPRDARRAGVDRDGDHRPSRRGAHGRRRAEHPPDPGGGGERLLRRHRSPGA